MLLGFLALAVVDSINPSAIVVTLYLLSRERAATQVTVYIAAIFLTYLTLGVAVMAGIDALLPSLTTAAESRIRDANVAEESANMTKFNILSQSGIAALAQANQAAGSVLGLLR